MDNVLPIGKAKMLYNMTNLDRLVIPTGYYTKLLIGVGEC